MIVPAPEAVVEAVEVIAEAAVVAEEVIVPAPEAVGGMNMSRSDSRGRRRRRGSDRVCA